MTLAELPALPAALGKTACIEQKDVGVADADFVDCYRVHYPRLVRAMELTGLGRAAAEDVAQEAFARTFAHWRRIARGTNPPGYAYRVAFRLAARREARTWRTPTNGEGARFAVPLPRAGPSAPVAGRGPGAPAGPAAELDDRPGSTDVAAETVLRVALAEAIGAMPPARRACAVLCLVAGLPTRDAAKALRIAESTVRKQIERARADLRSALG